MNFGIPVFASGVCVRMRVDVCPRVRVCVRVSVVLYFLVYIFVYICFLVCYFFMAHLSAHYWTFINFQWDV